ncbi:MAG: hypothetical protein HFI35_02100 [Roseburia sp.]|nr:hypothetical protein [Roseburia sp.]
MCCDGIVQYHEAPEGAQRKPWNLPDTEMLAGNREALEKMAWMERHPTKDPERLARREANHKEHM